MIHLLDCDLKGTTPIDRRIATGQIVVHPIPSYMEYQRVTGDLARNATRGDRVICDTYSNLLELIRFESRYGEDQEQDLWAKKGVDDPYGRSYDIAAKFAMARLKMLSARGFLISVVCHEAEVRDDTTIPVTKRRGPDVNDKHVNTLIGKSSDVYRLECLTEPIIENVEKDGQVEPKIVANVGQRVLYLKRQEHFIAKYSCDIERSMKIPTGIIDPTLPKVYEHLGCQPPMLLVYGPAGVGKTTFITSDVVPTESTPKK